MPFGISIWELLILLVVLLLVFGAKRLPEMGRSLGKGMREFKEAVTGDDTASARRTTRELPPPADDPDYVPEDEAASTKREPVI
jgi:sec-independent protein translocase protein TatA